MKKFLVLLVTIVLMMTLVSCKPQPSNDNGTDPQPPVGGNVDPDPPAGSYTSYEDDGVYFEYPDSWVLLFAEDIKNDSDLTLAALDLFGLWEEVIPYLEGLYIYNTDGIDESGYAEHFSFSRSIKPGYIDENYLADDVEFMKLNSEHYFQHDESFLWLQEPVVKSMGDHLGVFSSITFMAKTTKIVSYRMMIIDGDTSYNFAYSISADLAFAYGISADLAYDSEALLEHMVSSLYYS